MKNFFVFIIALVIFTFSTSFARNGDIIGDIYSTDIKAYINEVPVKSYNIGGKTCIAIEEITKSCSYNNDYRMLLVYSLTPSDLISYENNNNVVGKIVGHIYETDIKTYFYNQEITSYNIGGKTAVVIEDLGLPNDYSSIGGKTTWNPTNRTISLDFLYNSVSDSNLNDILVKNNYSLRIVDDIATFITSHATPGSFYAEFNDEKYNNTEYIFPIYMYKDGISYLVGYIFKNSTRCFSYDDNNNVSLEQDCIQFYNFDVELLRALANKTETNAPTREEIISEFLTAWMAEVIERYDTNEYSFLYLRQPTSHGSNEILFYVKSDGSYKELSKDLKTAARTRTLKDLEIDKENEKVRFNFTTLYSEIGISGGFYDSRYTIDLKNGTMTKVDIGGA